MVSETKIYVIAGDQDKKKACHPYLATFGYRKIYNLLFALTYK